MVTDWTKRHDKHEAMQIIGAAGVPAGAVLDTMELKNEPSFTERGIMQTMEHPAGPFKMPSWPVRFDGTPPKLKPAPMLGQHTDEVFGDWLGMSTGDIEALRQEKVHLSSSRWRKPCVQVTGRRRNAPPWSLRIRQRSSGEEIPRWRN